MIIKYLVVHTAAFEGKDCDASLIESWHKQRGWRGLGYHFVILNDLHRYKTDGTVEPGVATTKPGSHTAGIDHCSIGICCAGHGDYDDFTPAQYDSLIELLVALSIEHMLPVSRIIGHREINRILEKDNLPPRYRTRKSCPGQKIDLDSLRDRVTEALGDHAPLPTTASNDDSFSSAMIAIEQALTRLPNAMDEFMNFRYHPEVQDLLNQDAKHQ
ncbi:MAG: N-acetylmuramoyl-L-alanine amidase [Candidatus Azotimanducaceae bacterium]|jgi:N-acetylmuramoyl-L-alanine amidase